METPLWTAPDLFAHCAELSVEDREAFLALLESTQRQVVTEVRKLLAAHERAPEFLDRPAFEQVTATVEPSSSGSAKNEGWREWIRTRSKAFWLFLVADVLALGFYIFGLSLIVRYTNHESDNGFDIEMIQGRWHISSVDPNGPAAGKLLARDEIVSVNGLSAGPASLESTIQSIHPGAVYQIRVLRDGVVHDFDLTLGILRFSDLPIQLITYGTVSLAFFLTAVLLGWLRSDQLVARRAYLALVTEALVLAKVALTDYRPFLTGLPFAIFETVDSFDGIHFCLAYLFYCTLFERVLDARPWKSLLYILCPWSAWITVLRILIQSGIRMTWFDSSPGLVHYSFIIDSYFYVLAPLSICAVIVRNYIKVRQPDDRRRARWIVYGSIAGILPYMLVRLAGIFLVSVGNPWVETSGVCLILRRISIMAAIAIPIATGYAVYKHRMFDIGVVVRRGVRYLLAKSFLQFVLALPALGLVIALVRNANRTVADAILNNYWFVVLLALLAAVLKFRVPLRQWLDRRFFRESYHQEQILLALIDSVQKLDSLSEMAHKVGDSVAQVFHPESVAILYHNVRDRFFISAYSHGLADSQLRFRETSPFLALLEGEPEARQISSIRGIPAVELKRLEALKIDLAIPINSVAHRIAGVILLGRKLAEEPYTPEDRRLLAALAGQMAIVYDNLSLHQMLADREKTAEEFRSLLDTEGADRFRECPQCGRCYDLKITHCPDDGAVPEFSLAVSRTVDRYRLDRLIGKGGMGAVYEAEDLSLRRRVAVKVITGRADNPLALQRMYREARAAARLNHPNIIATYDFGISGDAAYLVMELLKGETLREAILRGGIDIGTAAVWLDQLLSGVEAAHRAGIIHRDLKPENVLISKSQEGAVQVKVLDFGIAKAITSDIADSTITKPGTVLGSLQYMSPEQLGGGTVDERSDIFSIGVMAFEVLTGRLPFSGNTYSERIISVMQGQISMPEGYKTLEPVLTSCLARNPSARFASIAALRNQLIPSMASFGESSYRAARS